MNESRENVPYHFTLEYIHCSGYSSPKVFSVQNLRKKERGGGRENPPDA